MKIETGHWPFCVGGITHDDATRHIMFDSRNGVWLCEKCFEELKELIAGTPQIRKVSTMFEVTYSKDGNLIEIALFDEYKDAEEFQFDLLKDGYPHVSLVEWNPQRRKE